MYYDHAEPPHLHGWYVNALNIAIVYEMGTAGG